MTTIKDFDDRVLGPERAFQSAAPPSAPLLEAVSAMKPVRARTRFGGFVVVALAGLVWPVVTLLRHPIRQDMPALPLAWVVLAAVLWCAAFALSLAAALVPRREDVLPAPSRASRLSGIAMAALVLFALTATVDAPGLSLRPADLHWSLFASCIHCVGFVFKISGIFLVVGVLALRRLVPVGGPRIGMALGAAGGAMGGFVLHFICPIAGTAHVVLGHAGGMVLAAAAGAILLPRLLRRH